MGFCIVDKIIHNQIIIHITHFDDYVQLVFQPLADLLRRLLSIMERHALITHALKIGHIIFFGRRFVKWQLGHAKSKIQLTLFRNFYRIVQRLRMGGKKSFHLRPAFQVKLLGLKLHVRFIVDCMVGLDTYQYALRLMIFLPDIMDVVGRHQPNPRFL